jgi:putative acetyltransferase
VSANFVAELSLVTEVHGHIVGHVMVSYAALHDDKTQRRIANLSPLAVAPEFQGRGIGSALTREVTAKADVRGEPLVVLEGSPAFYARLGFEHSEPYGIRMPLPASATREAAQVLRLRSYDPSMRGQVVYPAAFDEVTEHHEDPLGLVC